MDHYQETFNTWNKVATIYQDKFMTMDLYNDSYDFICDHITKLNARVLEIGCGPGNITKYLLAKRPDFDILGIDIAPNMIALAQKNNPSASFKVMDSREIDQITTPFEAVVCGFCLPYLSHSDSQKFIADCVELLNDNGLIYISFVEGDPEKSGFQTGSSGDRAFFYYYNLEYLQSQLVENNFYDLVVFKVTYAKSATETEIHTIITAKKASGKHP